MKKLHRITLFAAVLAFGVVACGDDVQIVDPPDPPPPALTVSFSPQQVSVAVGQSVDVGLNISGGAPGATATWDCSSANTAVATASSTDSGCRITGVAEGSTSVTANVTKGAQTASASAGVTVAEIERATVTISQINQGGLPANLNNVQGQLDVVLTVTPGDETLQRVDLVITDEDGNERVVNSHIWTAAMLAELAAEAEGPAEQSVNVTLSFNTDRYDPDWDAGTADIWHFNGPHTVSARLFVLQDPEFRGSQELGLNFNNPDGYAVQSFRQTNSALDSQGRRWYGGPDSGATEITAVPVFYSGMSAAQVTVTFCPPATGNTQTSTEAPHSFSFACANFESTAAGIEPAVSGQYVEDGDATPNTILNQMPGSFMHAEYRMPTRVDNRAPQNTGADAALVITTDPTTSNWGNWVNADYRFAQGYRSNMVTDAGVGKAPSPYWELFVRDVATGDEIHGPSATLTGAGLAETATNTEYRVGVRVWDRLGNTNTFLQATNPAAHALNTFGYDETDPTIIWRDDPAIVGQLTDQYNIVNELVAGVDHIAFRGEDVASGFAPAAEELAARHALLWIRGFWERPNPTEREAVVGANPQTNPFTRARDGLTIATLAGVPHMAVTQTAIQLEVDIAALDDRAGYFLYQIQLRDRAGNITRGYRAVYHNNNSMPEITSLDITGPFSGDMGEFAFAAVDSVEMVESSFDLLYPYQGGVRVIWERETADIVAALGIPMPYRAPHALPNGEGELFSDVIHRPLRDNLAFGGFLRSLVQVDLADDSPAADIGPRPDSLNFRMYNGWGSDQGDINHTSPTVAGDVGFSAYVQARIQPEQVSPMTVSWANSWSTAAPNDVDAFALRQEDDEDCDAQLCAWAIGPTGIFLSPFDAVYLIVFDGDAPASGANYRVVGPMAPNFNAPFPTRDEGEDEGRLFEWTFNNAPVGEFVCALGVRGADALASFCLTVDDPEDDMVFMTAPSSGALNRR